MLVSVKWLYENLNEVKILEIDFDPDINYYEGHIPNALLLPWKSLLHDKIRDFTPPEKFSKVLGNLGISENDFVVLYSDMGNRYAFYTYWLMKAYGHENVAILNGGIYKWLKEGYPVENKATLPSEKSNYIVKRVDWSSRIFLWELLSKLNSVELIDARNREEYEGLTSAPPEHKCEQTQVSGHIPNAKNIPWTLLFNEDGTLKEREELEKIFSSIDKDKEIVVYCRTGARASAVWYVLKEVLSYKNVRLYDGSWVEYGNLVGVPIER
ncbi:sulfurtransferase [Sulfolobus sp. S-194]|uniref:sulfurtransferase n=1 Tax=Sulfolobus sp. S-194 TaxID=2512240 RepID=UPI001436EA0E|nr:sulfurtransferase [Sulfolobus sp. S-194]QIW24701.1 sulfurtransferase [Sulfolobus sp. S-194]